MPMKIIMVIDNLGSGGAQRQLSLLAVLLKRRGHDVTLVTYNFGDFFEPLLEQEKIRRIKIEVQKWRRPIELAKILHQLNPDGVIAFQNAASFYAEIASLWRKNWRLVVSERVAIPVNQAGFLEKIIRLFHIMADIITTNSHTNRLLIESFLPIYKKKTFTIYNAVDLEYFKPINTHLNRDTVRFLVLSSHGFRKNFEGLAKAIALLKKETQLSKFKIDWFGSESPGWLKEDKALSQKYDVEDIVTFYPLTDKVVEELNQSEALILPSLWEGLPNAVCEALSTGCPVLISDICDARNLVIEGTTGFLFNPQSPQNIADTIRKFLHLTFDERQAMRRSARVFAEKLFDPEHFVTRYEQLLEGKLDDPVTGYRHWPISHNQTTNEN